MPNIETSLLDPETRSPAMVIKLDGSAHLFDCGRANYSMGVVNPLVALYLSHMHMDHLIGFDEILGLILGLRPGTEQNEQSRRMRVFGPPGVTASVRAKISAYTLNLLRPGAIKFEVYEIGQNKIAQTSISVPEDLEGLTRKSALPGDVIWHEDGYQVRFVELNHGIPSLGYAFETPDGLSVSKERLAESGLPPGPWLNDLKQGKPAVTIGGKDYSREDLQGLLVPSKGKRIVYVTDFILEDGTLAKLLPLTQGADTLYCEATYIDADRRIATRNHHLTSTQAGEIAKAGNVGELVLTHFSPRYEQAQLLAEARAVFERVR